eukprot:TRINITY_DN1145_c0_g1_i2.p1 TRINITY_DN1145_c0_g1~~TRINITY_DN1145_c0_g1_i2.p1  ORF type:complete len:122 (-),score=39.40 TRINITY_DN1145_c0_g1_i2:75-440(-)
MRINITDAAGTTYSLSLANDQSVAALKSQFLASEGVPVERQNLYNPNTRKMLEDNMLLCDVATGEGQVVTLWMQYGLKGAGASIDAGSFEVKFRTCCFYCGADGQWDRCQFLCVRCKCNIM